MWRRARVGFFFALATSIMTLGATVRAAFVVAGYDRNIVDQHKQLFTMSCIPMSVELVLKLTHHAPLDYFDLQQAWQNYQDGSFDNFNQVTVKGLTFRRQFANPRDDNFPLDQLFAEIDRELRQDRYVIISLPSGPNAHMWVVYGEDADNDFVAVSKGSDRTIDQTGIKGIVRSVKGTDILTYRVDPAAPGWSLPRVP